MAGIAGGLFGQRIPIHRSRMLLLLAGSQQCEQRMGRPFVRQAHHAAIQPQPPTHCHAPAIPTLALPDNQHTAVLALSVLNAARPAFC